MKKLPKKAFDQCQSVSNLSLNIIVLNQIYLFHFLIRCFNIIIIHGVKKEYVLAVSMEKVSNVLAHVFFFQIMMKEFI
jgi:hypothetical protein